MSYRYDSRTLELLLNKLLYLLLSDYVDICCRLVKHDDLVL